MYVVSKRMLAAIEVGEQLVLFCACYSRYSYFCGVVQITKFNLMHKDKANFQALDSRLISKNAKALYCRVYQTICICAQSIENHQTRVSYKTI